MANAQKAIALVMKQSIDELKHLVIDYRRKDAAHERMIGELKTLLENEDTDKALDIVRNEFNAIHGPSN